MENTDQSVESKDPNRFGKRIPASLRYSGEAQTMQTRSGSGALRAQALEMEHGPRRKDPAAQVACQVDRIGNACGCGWNGRKGRAT